MRDAGLWCAVSGPAESRKRQPDQPTVLRARTGIKNGRPRRVGLIRALGSLAQLLDGVGEERRGNWTDPCDLVRLDQSRIVRQQKEILITKTGQVVKTMR